MSFLTWFLIRTDSAAKHCLPMVSRAWFKAYRSLWDEVHCEVPRRPRQPWECVYSLRGNGRTSAHIIWSFIWVSSQVSWQISLGFSKHAFLTDFMAWAENPGNGDGAPSASRVEFDSIRSLHQKLDEDLSGYIDLKESDEVRMDIVVDYLLITR